VAGLRELGPRLWVAEAPLRFAGLEVGRRMNVVQLTDGGLFVHSPAPLDDALRAGLDALGEVRFVAAPSRIHGNLWLERYAAAYPGVELLAAPGLAERRKDIDFTAELGSEPDPRWAADLDQELFGGNRLINEVVFLHRPSRSLILGDLALNLGPESPRMTRLFARLGGMYGRLRPTPIFRLATRDKAAARESLERILSWDFDRVVVGHGAIWETGGREALRREWARVLSAR
jgi:glyoxylase-like metal-dependent hydrolase (beta-lactamase superfamily II)